MARTSLTISSFSIFFSKEFFRGANERKEQANLFKVSRNASLYLRICNVLTVPRQQIFHVIDSSHRNVERILCSYERDDALSYQRLK